MQSEAGVALDLPLDAAPRVAGLPAVLHGHDLPRPRDRAVARSAARSRRDVASMTERCSGGYPRATAWSYGAELFLRRATNQALSGWLSYTLGWSRGESEEGFDVHAELRRAPRRQPRAAVALRRRVRRRARGCTTARGKMASVDLPARPADPLRAAPARLLPRGPAAQLRLDYRLWPDARGARVVQRNARRASRSTSSAGNAPNTPTDPSSATPCPVRRAPALFFPNLGVRAEF